MKTICFVIIALIAYDIIKWTVRTLFTPSSKPDKKHKSFKEQLKEKQGIYQPTDKLDTSNPPK